MANKFGFISYYLTLFLLCLLFSCGKEQNEKIKSESNSLLKVRDTIEAKSDSAAIQPQPTQIAYTPIEKEIEVSSSKEVQIDTFSNFPSEIEGCSCYYSNNKEEFDNELYIYADNYNDDAYVSIGGEMTKFTLIKVDKSSNNHTIQTWKNDKYELVLDRKQVGQIEETWQQQGMLKIKEIGGKETRIKFYGECGC